MTEFGWCREGVVGWGGGVSQARPGRDEAKVWMGYPAAQATFPTE